jgi:hypothetical protein
VADGHGVIQGCIVKLRRTGGSSRRGEKRTGPPANSTRPTIWRSIRADDYLSSIAGTAGFGSSTRTGSFSKSGGVRAAAAHLHRQERACTAETIGTPNGTWLEGGIEAPGTAKSGVHSGSRPDGSQEGVLRMLEQRVWIVDRGMALKKYEKGKGGS